MRKEKKFRDHLDQRIPLLFDGATGTELYNRGVFINRCFEDANLSSPGLVEELHRLYLKAGAQVITTNSWGANYFKLKNHNLHDKVAVINKTSAELARGIVKDEAFVSGSIGPLGVRLEPWGPVSFQEARDVYIQQAQGLKSGGVDCFSLETFSDIRELQEAIQACKEVDADMPILAQIMINIDGKLTMGSPLEFVVEKMATWGADAIGLNCSVGPQPMLTAIPVIKAASSLPIIIQPNAGLPKGVDGRTIYMCTPEYMASFTKSFLQEGVLMIGGCCGTTAEHIKAMAQAFRQHRAMVAPTEELHSPTVASGLKSENLEIKEMRRVPFETKSKWSQKIADGKPVFTIELLPPAGINPDKILERSTLIKESGIDAINIPDGPRASARMSAILTAVMIEQRVGIETILHYTCRDRNLLGMQSDMLGAHAIGLRNMLLVTGDPPKLGTYPDATGVFDVDAIGLTNMVHKLNGGLDLGERHLDSPTEISIGVGVNPVHRDFAYEMKRFRYKVEAGAEWAITQPVFDVTTLFRFLDYIEEQNIRIPIIAGIWPLTSLRNAVFMNNEVPGVVIPDDVITRMEKHTSPEDSKKEGVAIAQEMTDKIMHRVQGVQVSAPFGRIDLALKSIGKPYPK